MSQRTNSDHGPRMEPDHPAWCLGVPWCAAPATGHRHREGLLHTSTGWRVETALWREALERDDSGTYVQLFSDELAEPGHYSYEIHLEPEEARHLARLLVEAADRLQQLREASRAA